jgi:predicted ATP-binding protein involved in virulence
MKLIGIKINQKGTVDSVKKNLKQEWYPFLNDYYFEDKDITDLSNEQLLKKIKNNGVSECELYTTDKQGPDISVHAIVGKNGSGKSTILEILFRIINNSAYNTLSNANWRTNNSESLLYSKGVSADLFYSMNNIYYCLGEKQLLELDNTIETINIDKNNTFEEHKKLLQKIFYTVVVNYSQYSLNIREVYELESSNYIEKKDIYGRQLYYKIKDNKGNETLEESKTIQREHWLNGLFHKNDGYLTPIVLNPMRTEGNIDFNTERNLSSQRLFGLLILRPDFLNEYKAKWVEVSFSLKKIKDKIEKQLNNFESNYYDILFLIYNSWWSKINIDKLYSENKNTFSNEMGNNQLNKITNKTDLDSLFNANEKGYSDRVQQIQATLLYLAYKTIEVRSKYIDFDYNLITDIDALINKIDTEPSHITLKIRQAKNHIIKRLLSVEYIPISNIINKEIDKDFKIFLDKEKIQNNTLTIDEVFDILYPPVYEANVLLTKDKKDVHLWDMSSGERQILYSLSSVLYHLMNLQSVVEDEHRVHYNHVNIILDEVEMYYHPEYQREFVDKLLSLINGLKLDKEKIKSINICIVTHSPFLLSDILKSNILFLEKGVVANNKVNEETFGANFYDILKNGFFLDENALGCFVNKKLKEVIEFINKERNQNKNITKEEAKRIVELIGDPFLKGYLLDKLEQYV